KEYDLQSAYDLVRDSENWQSGTDFSIVVERDGKEMKFTGKVTQPTDKEVQIREMDLPEDDPKVKLRKAWLKD
ncbi:MAG: peptidase M61, partial [Gillisia sp.]